MLVPGDQSRYGGEADARLPVFVTLRRYAEELKAEPELSLDDFILRSGAAATIGGDVASDENGDHLIEPMAMPFHRKPVDQRAQVGVPGGHR